jgi:Tfp pilus assembly protein PilO
VKRNVLIAIGAGVVVVLLLWYFLLFAPLGKDADDARQKADQEQRARVDLQAQVARLKELSQNRTQQQATLRKLDAAIPENPNLGDFILQANDIAAKSGIDWLSISPSPPAAGAGAGLSSITVAMQIQGGFFQALDYLNRLEDLDRLVVVDSVNVAPAGGGSTLSLTLTGRMFTRAPAAASGSGTATTPGTTAPSTTNTTAPSGTATTGART